MRGYHRCLMIGAIVLGWSSASLATDVFGIKLHQPLNTPECLMRQDAYLSDDHEQCFKWPEGVTHADSLPSDGQIIVNVPLEDRPSYMSGNDVVVGLKDGLVVSVSAKTHGTVGGGDDLHGLTEAFGKPQQDPGQTTTPWSLSHGITIYYNDNEWGPYFGLVRVQGPDASPHQSGVWD